MGRALREGTSKATPQNYGIARQQLIARLAGTPSEPLGQAVVQHQTPAAAVTVARPTVTLVRYANRAYLHVNGEPSHRAFDSADASAVLFALERIEATGAVVLDVQELRHLTV